MLYEGFNSMRKEWKWEDDEWYYSVVDFVAVVIGADYDHARKYWNKLKERLSRMENVRGISEISDFELVTKIFNNCH